MTTKAASVDKLNELHCLMIDKMIDAMDGETSPAMLSIIRQTLKDANIEPARDNKQMLQLRDSLPTLESIDDEEFEEFVAPQPRTG